MATACCRQQAKCKPSHVPFPVITVVTGFLSRFSVLNLKVLTMSTVTIPASQITRESFVASLAKRAASGDAAALSLLIHPKSQDLAFVEFLQTIATKTKTPFLDVLQRVNPDDLDALQKSLPKDSPQRAMIATALKSIPVAPTIKLTGAGEKTFADGTQNAHDLLCVSLKGDTRFSESHASAWWRAFLTVTEHEPTMESIRAFIAVNSK